MKKPSTTVIVVGAGVVLLGVYLWRKKKSDQAAAAAASTSVVQEIQPALDQIQMPVQQDQKQIYLPGALLEPTLPNTGIVPPAKAAGSTSIPTVAPAPAPSVVQSQPVKVQTANVKSATLVAQKGTTTARPLLRGLAGNAYILN